MYFMYLMYFTKSLNSSQDYLSAIIEPYVNTLNHLLVYVSCYEDRNIIILSTVGCHFCRLLLRLLFHESCG